MPGTIEVTVLLFAVYRERVGRDRLTLTLPEGATVADAVRAVGEGYPQVASLAGTTMVAVNQEYAVGIQPLHEDDEVALIPPVSGGGRQEISDGLSSQASSVGGPGCPEREHE